MVDRQRGAGVDEIYSDFRTNATFTTPGGVPTLVVTGPFNATGAGDTPSRRAIFSCKPASSAAEETACARTILSPLARRAYRGPVSAAEVNTLIEFYREGRKSGDFDSGIQQALARILVAPRFVYRIEEEPATVASGQVYRISDVELASRLSFFLWSSIPDEELLDVATKGRLRDPQTLAQQVKRMLADQRADALVENFAGQWLYLRELENVQTDARNFDENLRRSFRRETEMLFERHRPRRSQPHRSARRRLHLRRRAARPALRHPERERQLLPPRVAGGRQSAPRPARPRQRPDGHVNGDANLAGRAW